MNKDKPISLEERKHVQLEMLKEIDTFCRKNNIRYSLAFGTLLGAIRHKGFIPWDDDVDILMPLPDMYRFKELFHSETMKYCDVDTEKYYLYGFSRIANTNTYNKIGLVAKSYGINIDLYPVVSVPHNGIDCEKFFYKANNLFKKRVSLMRWYSILTRLLPIKTIPFLESSVKEYRDYLLNVNNYGNTGRYYIVAGPLELRDKMMYDFDLFDQTIQVEFEGSKFMAISEYDKYLSMRYGDYMALPPEDQRHPYHGGNYYWKY